MFRSWLIVATCACSQPRTEPVPPTQVAAQVAAKSSDASVVSSEAGPDAIAPPSYRAFVPPQPIAPPGAATRADKKCRTSGPADLAYEIAREVSALDAELRTKGSMLLPTRALNYGHPSVPQGTQAGQVIRGPQGERWLLIAGISRCGLGDVPLVTLDPSNEVYLVHPDPKPRSTRKVALCEPVCGGCGMQPPPTPVVVEVPEGAQFVGTRMVAFPLDTKVLFVSNDARGRPKRCQPVP